jgi:hypothetical protein
VQQSDSLYRQPSSNTVLLSALYAVRTVPATQNRQADQLPPLAGNSSLSQLGARTYRDCRQRKGGRPCKTSSRIYRKWHGTDISQQTLLMYKGLPKATNATMIQLRTRKIRLRSYLYGIRATETGDCECRQDLQTVRHVVCECPLLSSRRKALLGRTTVWDNSTGAQ